MTDLYTNNVKPFTEIANGAAIMRLGHIFFGWRNGARDREVSLIGINDYSNKQVISFQTLRTESAMSFASSASPVDDIQIEMIINKSRYSDIIQELYALTLVTPVVPLHNALIASIMQPVYTDEKVYFHYGFDISPDSTYTELMKAYAFTPVMVRINNITQSNIETKPDDIRLVLSVSRVITSNCYGNVNLYLKSLDDMLLQEDVFTGAEDMCHDNAYVNKIGDILGLNMVNIKSTLEKIKMYSSMGSLPPSELGNLCIATYNVRDFITAKAKENTLNIIKENNIDIIVIEEHPGKMSLPLSKDYKKVSSDNGNKGDTSDDNIVVYSRQPILSYNKVCVNKTYMDPVSKKSMSMENTRQPLYVKLSINGKIVHLYGTHLKSGIGDEEITLQTRRAQSYALQTHIRSKHDIKKDYIVICGDFNTVIKPKYNALKQPANDDFDKDGTLSYLSFTDDEDKTNDFVAINYSYLANEPTYFNSSDNGMLDHIILSPALYQLYIRDSIRIIKTPVASDHYPVTIKLEV